MSSKNPSFVVGTFFTENTPYEEVYNNYLKKSLNNYKNIDHFCIKTKNQGSWIKNVAEKPKIILNLLDQLYKNEDDRNLIFLDSDSTLECYPELFDNIPEEYDIALHELKWDQWYNRPNDKKTEILSGTLFFRNNNRVRNLLTRWYCNAIISNLWEQKILEKLLKEENTVKIYNLPLSYCYISSLPNGQKPYVKLAEPVVVHHQASRTLKRIINN